MLPLATTLTVPSSYADGRVSWDNRLNGNGVDNVTGLVATVGGRQDTANQFCYAFTFKFGDGTTGSGIPQGRQIVTARLRLHSNNANTVVDASSIPTLSYLWIGVENNLNPTKQGKAMAAPNPDRFHDNTSASALAGNPWQRLTAQSAATTYFDSGRTGVVHSGALTTVVGPRNTNALIYQAFAQPTLTWPATSWNYTNDFAPALSKLVQDSGWNGNEQYVTVFMFVANTDAQGSAFGVGNLGTIGYANGQNGVDTPIGANAGGQIHMQESAFAPQLELTHQSSSPYEALDIAAPAVPSTLGGQAYLIGRGPTNVMRGKRWDQSATGGVIPKVSAAAGDTPIWDMVAHNPQSSAWALSGGAPLDSKVKHRDNVTAMPSKASLLLEGYAGQACNFTIRPAFWPHEDIDWNLQAYSLRFYYQIENTAPISSWWVPIGFLKAPGTYWPEGGGATYNFVWDIQSEGNRTDSIPVGGTQHHGEIRTRCYNPASPTNPSVMNPYEFGYNVNPQSLAWRWEIQVDQNRSPKIRIRVYNTPDGTIPYKTWQANPSLDVSAGLVRMGKIEAGFLPIAHYGDFEFHPNYNLSGEFQDPVRTDTGTPYVPQTWDWFEWDGAKGQPLVDLGTVTAITSGIATLDGVALTNEVDNRDVYNPNGYTSTTEIVYNSGIRLDRHRPNGFTGVALPCMIYVHGGFWLSGDKGEPMSYGLPDLFTSLGWEFVSINYTLSRGPTPLSSTYPTWNAAADTGRHPSHIIQTKLAAKFMAAQTGIDPTRIAIMGHSAGAYLAGAAVYSRGLNIYNAGVGTLGTHNLTVSNTTYGGTGGAVDPEFIGVLMLTAPVDLPMACAYDPSVAWPLLGVDGNIRQTARCYMGRIQGEAINAEGTELWRYVRDNTAAMPPTYYQQGGTDFLVHWRHWELLQAELDAKDLPYIHRYQFDTQHDSAKKEFDVDAITQWLETL
jgi:acetyl esterase/lipase